MKEISYKYKTPLTGTPGTYAHGLIETIPIDEVVICEFKLYRVASITYQGGVIDENHLIITYHMNTIVFYNKNKRTDPGPPHPLSHLMPIGFRPVLALKTDTNFDIDYLIKVMNQYKSMTPNDIKVDLLISQLRFIIELIEIQMKDTEMYTKRVDSKIKLIEELRKKCVTTKNRNSLPKRKTISRIKNRTSSGKTLVSRSTSTQTS